MASFSDPEGISWLRFALASTTILGLMGALAFGLKYIAARGLMRMAPPGTTRRLRVVETLQLDMRRRLVIVRCDETEYLLLLGLNQDTVVASPINKIRLHEGGEG